MARPAVDSHSERDRRQLRATHQASVEAFQAWGGVTADGVVGDQTWSVSLHAASATLESKVGLNFVMG
jgi:murein L,D-transpeptidase YcbB/YkuD